MHVPRYRHALLIALMALVGSLLTMAPSLAASDCPSGQTQYKIDNAPSNGTYGDGTLSVTISNADSDSFSWSSNIEVESVMVKGGTSLKANPGGTSGSASSAQNPNSGKPYGISHVSFCYSETSAGSTGGGGGGGSTGGGSTGGDSDDCVSKGNGNGKGHDCDEEDECEGGRRMGSTDPACDDDAEDECEGGRRMGSTGPACDDDEDDECEGGRRMGSTDPACDDDEDDECEGGRRMGSTDPACDDDPDDECEAGRRMGSTGPACEETLADAEENPAGATGPGRIDSGAEPATEVRGLRIADNPADSGDVAARAQVRGQQEEGGVLPFTGGAPLAYVLMGLGLIGSGSLLWSRRRKG